MDQHQHHCFFSFVSGPLNRPVGQSADIQLAHAVAYSVTPPGSPSISTSSKSVRNHIKSYGLGSKPYSPCEHQNSW